MDNLLPAPFIDPHHPPQLPPPAPPEVVVLRPRGYINDRLGAALREECEQALASDLRNIIISFERSEHINSIGISNLIAVIEKVEEMGAKLVFSNLPFTVKEVFDLMGISRHVRICTDAESARREMGIA